jgi:hypothetical protein
LVHDLPCAAPQGCHRIECLEHLASYEVLIQPSHSSLAQHNTRSRATPIWARAAPQACHRIERLEHLPQCDMFLRNSAHTWLFSSAPSAMGISGRIR